MPAPETLIETSRGRFPALERGRRGDPLVVCLHGFPDDPGTFVPLLDRLAGGGFHAIAPWLRGYHPAPTTGPLDGRALLADLMAQLDVIAPDRPVRLVGHDFGALVTYRAIARAPARFERAVTLAVPHPVALRTYVARHPTQLARFAYVALFQAPRLASWLVSRGDFYAIERMWRAASPGFTPPPGRLAEVKATLARSLPAPIAMYRAGGFLTRGRSPVPVLALHGAQDGVIAADMAGAQAAVLGSHGSVEILPGCGHFLHLERPDAVAQPILRWFAAGAEVAARSGAEAAPAPP